MKRSYLCKLTGNPKMAEEDLREVIKMCNIWTGDHYNQKIENAARYNLANLLHMKFKENPDNGDELRKEAWDHYKFILEKMDEKIKSFNRFNEPSDNPKWLESARRMKRIME